MNWIEEQLREISKSRALIYFGAALALTHLFTFYAWSGGEYPARFAFASRTSVNEVCWPILTGCRHLKILNDVSLLWVTRLYAVLALIAAGAFVARKVDLGYALLAAATVFKVFFYAMDYRFGGEWHYVLFLASFIYLLLPGKTSGLQYLVLLTYVFAGLLHVNSGWMSGAEILPAVRGHGVMKWMWEHGLWTPSAAYVAFLCAVLSFGLLSRDRVIFWATLSQLILLHVIATPLTGFVGTALALGFLSIAPLVRVFETEPPRLALPALTLVSVFGLLQILPMITAGDHVLTGEGRLGAVTMYDAARSCRSAVIANFDRRSVDMTRDNGAPPQWLECDPYFMYKQLRHLCVDLSADPDFRRLTWAMQSRRGYSGAYRSVVALDDVCRLDVRYSWLGRNDWVNR